MNTNSKFAWNLGDIFDAVGEAVEPTRPALIHRERTLSWSEFNASTNNLAKNLIARGASPNDKVAFYLANGTQYTQLVVACMKARLVHVNVNYRYLEDELHYIIDNSDAKFVVYSSQFSARIANIHSRCNNVSHFIEVDDSGAAGPPKNDFAEDMKGLLNEGDGHRLDIRRSPDDLVFIYTGGTTGMPKGVMWRQHDLWGGFGGGKSHPCAYRVLDNVNELAAAVKSYEKPLTQLIACPLMHGTGLFTALTTLTGGGTLVTMGVNGLDPELTWQTAQDSKVKSIVIVGDAFAKPMLNTLETTPGRWDLSALRLIISSGVMWSSETKEGLMNLIPQLICADLFGSSEALGFGNSISSEETGVQTARFRIGDHCKVFTESQREVLPGSDQKGFVARTGAIPLGYYKDEAKSQKTFPVINGVRYSVPGDWCTVDENGFIRLLGRGSACINTAGEKVYPEEVEEALKRHADIDDALVIGLEDEKWGMAVTAILKPRAGKVIETSGIHSHIKTLLAAYKAPKNYVMSGKSFRAVNGKADYKSAKTFAIESL
tara:strand:+ start:2279 stop:3916 length:1638 start_codon:yes stop_codon:yes gene_type:complete